MLKPHEDHAASVLYEMKEFLNTGSTKFIVKPLLP